MAQQNDDVFNRSEKDTTATGRDIPGGDGTVSDEDVNAIEDTGEGKKTGQDHSLEDYEKSMPDEGVGAIQDPNEISSGVARIND